MYVCVCVCEFVPSSSVGIATDHGVDAPGSNPGGDKIFPPVQTGPGAHPAYCKMGTASILGGKVRPGRVAAHSRPSSAAVMEEYSYTSHPLGHVGPVTVSLYLYCRYIRQNPASSNTVPPCGRMIYLYILPYNHTPIMECGPAQRESSSETT